MQHLIRPAGVVIGLSRGCGGFVHAKEGMTKAQLRRFRHAILGAAARDRTASLIYHLTESQGHSEVLSPLLHSKALLHTNLKCY